MTHPITDITIIGGGPTGLFASFYTGMRGATAQIVDALPELGGQLTALYPEKYIFDVGGFAKILAKDLVKALKEQVEQFHHKAHLNQNVTALERSDDPLAELPAAFDAESLTGHVVLVGYGRVGSRIAEALAARGIRLVVAEQNRELVERLRERNIPAVSGDATEPAVLIQAHVARASLLVVATPDAFQVRKMVETARALNPRIETLLRTHSDEEAALLRRDDLGTVFMGEHELALAMTRGVLERVHAAASAPIVSA